MQMKSTLFVLLLAASLGAYAADKLIFACTNAQGKQVRVTERDGKYRYRFGRPNRVELVFEDDKRAAVRRSPRWNGIGRDLWTNLVLQNGDYRYTLFSSMDRLSAAHPVSYGVVVERLVNGEERYVNEIKCSRKYKITQNFPDEVLF